MTKKQGRCFGGKAFHVLPDACSAGFERIWTDDESTKAVSEAEKDARANNLECSRSGETIGSTFSRRYIVKFERTKISDKVIIDAKDSR